MSNTQWLYHIAPAAEIERAARSGRYSPATLASEGFIHCSYARQLAATAAHHFHGRTNLLVLEIDPSRLDSRVVTENLSGGAELFPHIYGSLPMSAVLAIRELRCNADGSFTMPCIVHDQAPAMTELDLYLQKYFMDAAAFAAYCGIEPDELADLVRRELVPAPSYRVRQGMLESFVFGALPAPGAAPGEYFRPEMAEWIAAVRHDLSTHGVAGAQQRARQMFADPFVTALRSSNATMYRLDDAFDASGAPRSDGLDARVASAWEHFLHGTFGLCVANPGSIHEIARKEVLQEQLTALTNNGTRATFTDRERAPLLALIDDYASASMPFSPIEYSRSSRKRLVDDVRARLNFAR